MHPDEERKQITQVQRQLAAVKDALARLTDHVSGLTARLRPILVSSPPSTAETKPGDAPELVPLANDLRELEGRVEIEANRILALIERCQL